MDFKTIFQESLLPLGILIVLTIITTGLTYYATDLTISAFGEGTGQDTTEGDTQADSPRQSQVPAQANSSLLELELIVEKTQYAAGENFSGERTLNYSGDLFEGVVMHVYSDGTEKHYTCITSEIKNGLFDEREFSLLNRGKNFKAFQLSSGAMIVSDSFTKKGDYTFKTAVYDCDSIEKAVLVDDFFDKPIKCTGISSPSSSRNCEQIEQNITPLKSVEKTITVT